MLFKKIDFKIPSIILQTPGAVLWESQTQGFKENRQEFFFKMWKKKIALEASRSEDDRKIFPKGFFVIEKRPRLIDSLQGGQKDNEETKNVMKLCCNEKGYKQHEVIMNTRL